jgi:hypothetical protein
MLAAAAGAEFATIEYAEAQRLLGILARKIFRVWKSSQRFFFTGPSCSAPENSVKSLVGNVANAVQRRLAHGHSEYRFVDFFAGRQLTAPDNVQNSKLN